MILVFLLPLIKTMYNTQLSNLDKHFDVKNIIYGAPVLQKVPSNKPNQKDIEFKRVPMTIKTPEGISDLVVETPPGLFSLGVKKNELGENGGYTLGICLYNKEGPTPEQAVWVEKFLEILEHTKRHLVSIRDKLGKPKLEVSGLEEKFSPLKFRKNKETGVEDTNSPSIFPKLIENKKTNKFLSLFTDVDDNELDPLSLVDKFGTVDTAIRLDGVFVGAVTAFQIKVYQCRFTPIEGGMKRLLPKRSSSETVTATEYNPLLVQRDEEDDDEEEEDKIKKDDEDEDVPEIVREPTPPPVVVKKNKAPKKV